MTLTLVKSAPVLLPNRPEVPLKARVTAYLFFIREEPNIKPCKNAAGTQLLNKPFAERCI